MKRFIIGLIAGVAGYKLYESVAAPYVTPIVNKVREKVSTKLTELKEKVKAAEAAAEATPVEEVK